jgi:hypothetical protein
VTDSTPVEAGFDRRRAGLAALVGVGTHVLAFLVSYLVARLSTNAQGLADIGHAVTAYFLIEILAGLGSLIGGLLLFRRGQRDVGLGLVLGWLVGLVLTVVFLSIAAS